MDDPSLSILCPRRLWKPHLHIFFNTLQMAHRIQTQLWMIYNFDIDITKIMLNMCWIIEFLFELFMIRCLGRKLLSFALAWKQKINIYPCLSQFRPLFRPPTVHNYATFFFSFTFYSLKEGLPSFYRIKKGIKSWVEKQGQV